MHALVYLKKCLRIFYWSKEHKIRGYIFLDRSNQGLYEIQKKSLRKGVVKDKPFVKDTLGRIYELDGKEGSNKKRWSLDFF